MYAGKIIERGSVDDIFSRPHHPYTRGLLKSVPHFDSTARKKRLETIPGLVPSLANLPEGCRFQDRCAFSSEKCHLHHPPLEKVDEHHLVACYHPQNNKDAVNV
jgi:oligopeptide/dipeptide ABC transporter ATP-binding protein